MWQFFAEPEDRPRMDQSDQTSDTPPLADGQRAAEFVRLLTGHQRRLFLYILTLLPRAADAEEVLQETNMVLWRRANEFTPGTDFAAWSSKVAFYEVLTFRKRRQRERLEFSGPLIEVLAREAAVGDAWEPRRTALASCLAKLNAADRDLVERRYLAGATTESVARQLNRPVKSIYRSLDRIRTLLMDCIRRSVAAEARG